MEALLYTLGVLFFTFAILASIGLHELGHMIPAKKFGGKVTQYFIGFGPTVWSRQRGETEYGLKLIPLGGYVKIVGMLPPGAEQLAESVEVGPDGQQMVKVRKSNTGLFTQLISDARAAEWELIGPEDDERLFYKLPWWKKVIVMAGGPSVNIAIAFFIFAGIFATYGNPADLEIDPVIAEVEACIVPADEAGRVCTADEIASNPTPARLAGLQVGDRLLAFNGIPVGDWEDLQEVIRANNDGRAELLIERDGVEQTLVTNTKVTPRPLEPGDDTETPVGFLGVSPEVDFATGGVGYTLGEMGEMTVNTVQAIGTLPVKVWEVAKAIVGLQERDPEGPVSVVGGGRIAGETTAQQEVPLVARGVFVLLLIAGFNFFIGMFNFIPLLPLDGGHIASATWEGIRRGWAKLRRRPDPGYVDAAKLLPIAYVMASVMLVMGVVLIVADFVVPLSLNS